MTEMLLVRIPTTETIFRVSFIRIKARVQICWKLYSGMVESAVILQIGGWVDIEERLAYNTQIYGLQ